MQLLPNPLGLFALIFGILLTMRKLDVSHRLAEQFPNAPKADFESWKARAMAAYGFGIWACFLKLVIDFVGMYAMARLHPSKELAMGLGVSLDVAWVVALVVTWRRVRAAHAIAERLGIEVQARPEADPET